MVIALKFSLGKLWYFNSPFICACCCSQVEWSLSPTLSLVINRKERRNVLGLLSQAFRGLESFTFSFLKPNCHAVRKSNPNYRMLRDYVERETRMRGHLGRSGTSQALNKHSYVGIPHKTSRAASLKPDNPQNHKK